MDERTLGELAAPDVSFQTMSIQYPDGQCELKSGLIHLLPKFHGLAGEDMHKHLKEFHTVCTTMRPAGVTEEHIKLKTFPFSLQDAAKDWLYYMPAGSVTNWEGLKRVFLEKFFPASRVTSIRKEICGIKQQDRESLFEYWERFNRLCTSCPYHQINEQLLIQYFYEGLIAIDRQMIDAASGGVLVEKTPAAARQLCLRWLQGRLKGNEKVNMGRNVSTLIEKPAAAIPGKCKDLGTFTIPCVIGNNLFENVMLDLGASINFMHLSVFTSLFIGHLKPTDVVIQLANRSTVQPTRLIEDVLIQVNKLIFPADFYILDMGGEDSNSGATTIILGRPDVA
ncbi:hypothetical protein VNO80_10326 [Phaseolus coccineus]|uniref:Retrotransposon gag domain-containing protein n=1 Tax=Phaseolus coccineus TaxID=3886 RepID=A0AAN9RDC3_PHACN